MMAYHIFKTILDKILTPSTDTFPVIDKIPVNLLQEITDKKSANAGITMSTDLIKQVEAVSVHSKDKVKKFGQVFTPTHLIQEMCDSLSPETWSDPNRTVFDPTAGKGNMIAIVVTRMMAGLKDIIQDEEARYKHIMENMIYQGELQLENALEIERIFNPDGKYKLNLYVGDVLKMPEDFFDLPYEERLKKYPQNCSAQVTL